MAFKFVALASLLAVASAGVVAPLGFASYAAAPAYGYAAHAAPLAYAATPVLAKVNTEYDPNPQYHYAYSVADAITGDNKHQEETRNGDVVKGSYSLVEADGTRRVVEYTADPINGFNAVVHKEGVAVHQKAIVKTVVAAPAVHYAAAPAVYAAAPAVAHYAAPAVAYAASPVAHYAAAPAVAHYAAPAVTHYAAAPAVAHYAAPAVAHYAAAPAVAYHAAAPAVHYAAAPAYSYAG